MMKSYLSPLAMVRELTTSGLISWPSEATTVMLSPGTVRVMGQWEVTAETVRNLHSNVFYLSVI